MVARDVPEFTRRTPFRPFRIHTTEGRICTIRHPDQVVTLRTRVAVVPDFGDRYAEVPQTLDHVALAHIVRMEELESADGTSG